MRVAGLPSGVRVVEHANRHVLVTLTRTGVLRVHAGFRFAPEPVLFAIARWARPRLRRSERLAAGRLLAAFPVHAHVPSAPAAGRRAEGPADGGRPDWLERLVVLHSRLNQQHFGGSLGPVDLRISTRMRRRLGEFRPGARAPERAQISLSLRHLRREGWSRAEETLLHEMVHQWQAETSRPLGHGPQFRRKCAELGIDGRAVGHGVSH